MGIPQELRAVKNLAVLVFLGESPGRADRDSGLDDDEGGLKPGEDILQGGEVVVLEVLVVRRGDADKDEVAGVDVLPRPEVQVVEFEGGA